MNKPSTTRTVLALAVAAFIAACGGESSAPSSAQEFAAAITSNPPRSDRLRALGAGGGSTAAAAVAITNDQLFQWARQTYPDLFPGTPQSVTIPYEGKVFDVRAFGNGNYLGVSNGEAYGYGPFVGGVLHSFGPVSQYADMVCATVNCTPPGGGGGGTGSLNGCTMPASEALRTGNRYRAVYVNSILVAPLSSGEHTVEGVVDGPATFEGQSAIKVTNTVKGFQSGQTVDATVKSYEQIAANDLTGSVGAETDAAFAGVNLTLRTVFNPVSLNDEFTLQPGQTLNKTISTTSTYVNAPFPLPPTTGSGTTAVTYEARETITVLGRSYDTCRYKDLAQNSQTPGYTWYIYGKGLPARQESLNAAGTVIERTELKSATINGAPL